MNPVNSLLTTLPWYAWVAIVAITCGAATSIVKMMIAHRERMEEIRAGAQKHPPEGKI